MALIVTRRSGGGGDGLSAAAVQALIDAAIADHSAVTTAVHGFADTADIDVRLVQLIVTAPGVAPTTGDGKAHMDVPPELDGWLLTGVAARASTAQTAGTTSIQVRRERAGSSVDMLSTTISFDNSEKSSRTENAPPVIDTANDDVQTDDIVYVDVDQIGTDLAGLIVSLTFSPP